MLAAVSLIILVAALLHGAPHLTRRDIFFGVTVPAQFRTSSVSRSVARRYAWEVWGLALVAAALIATSPFPAASGAALLTQTVGALVAFTRARRAVRPHAVAPRTTREAELGPRPGLPGGWVGQCGPFVIVIVAALFATWQWDRIPARFPTHWNVVGRPNGWTAKSTGGVYRGVGIGIVLCGMMLFSSYAVLRWSRLPRVTGADGVQSRRVRQANLVATLASAYLVALLIAWVTVSPTFSGPGDGGRLPLALLVPPWVLVVVGGGAIRAMRRTAASESPPLGDTTPDDQWILGHLYVNRADPALFVEKRMGFGYTLNLGNPRSWVVVVVFVTALAIPFVLLP